MIKEMLSEASAVSCMRFCVVLIVGTTMLNWTIGTVAVLFELAEEASINISEIVALLGTLGMKMGQKKLENVGSK